MITIRRHVRRDCSLIVFSRQHHHCQQTCDLVTRDFRPPCASFPRHVCRPSVRQLVCVRVIKLLLSFCKHRALTRAHTSAPTHTRARRHRYPETRRNRSSITFTVIPITLLLILFLRTIFNTPTIMSTCYSD